MSNKFKIEIATPGKLAYSGEVELAVIPGDEGEIGVLPEHAETLTTLKSGVVKIYEGDTVVDRVFVAGGFSEINPNEVSVLATEAEDLKKIDRKDIEAKISEAQIKLKTADTEFQKNLAQDAIELNENILSALSEN